MRSIREWCEPSAAGASNAFPPAIPSQCLDLQVRQRTRIERHREHAISEASLLSLSNKAIEMCRPQSVGGVGLVDERHDCYHLADCPIYRRMRTGPWLAAAVQQHGQARATRNPVVSVGCEVTSQFFANARSVSTLRVPDDLDDEGRDGGASTSQMGLMHRTALSVCLPLCEACGRFSPAGWGDHPNAFAAPAAYSKQPLVGDVSLRSRSMLVRLQLLSNRWFCCQSMASANGWMK